MPLQPGTMVGQYEIRSLIGAGGMGEVYLGFDTKLKRDVAIKVLPPAFARDPERVARFRREATVLASLNHPNIAAIYGIEDSGPQPCLVMEYVPGETLADRTRREGAVPMDEALQICTQIAEALEHAHEKTVIHRDLKPANVKVTPEGLVKVLDFGLAKAFAAVPESGDPGDSPTLSAMPTLPGVILGTAAYMSPEQAKGRKVDKRTDIWALGCVLYELVTGQGAFYQSRHQSRARQQAVHQSPDRQRGVKDAEPDTVQEIIANILKGEPDWTALPADTPPHVRMILRRSLQKDPAKRLRSAADIAIAIEEGGAISGVAGANQSPQQAPGWRLAAMLGVAVVLGSLATWLLKPSPPAPGPVARFSVSLPADQRLAGLDYSAIAISPDGARFAYVATRGGIQQLFLGTPESQDAKPIAGTAGAFDPFFSPDGQWLGFMAEGKLKKVSVSGGAPVVLAPANTNSRGASWGTDGDIIFAGGFVDGLVRVPESGGTPEPLTTLDAKKGEGSHRWPHHLPGGKAILFTVGTGGSWDDARIEALRLDTGERKALIEGGSDARYSSTGHLIYVRAGALLAAPLDPDRLEITDPPVAVVEGIMPSPGNTGALLAGFSDQGWLAYVPGTSQALERRLVWLDRKGTEEVIPVPPRAYDYPEISPDGRRIAVGIDEGNRWGLWLYDIARGTLTRLTFDSSAYTAVWSPDGKKLVYRSQKAGPWNLFWKPADGSGSEERLTTSEFNPLPSSWSTDGKLLAITEDRPATRRDIAVLSFQENRKIAPFLQTAFQETSPAFSPDGRWLAYTSDESGRDEVYVQPYPGPGEKFQISTEGGLAPIWNPNGRELFYRNGNRFMAVAIATQPAFRPGKPEVIIVGSYRGVTQRQRNYAVTADGQRFLMIKESEQVAPTQINVVLNWFEELKRRVPVTSDK